MDLQKYEFLYIAIGFVEFIIALQSSLIVPYKVKYTFIYNTAIKYRYYTQGKWKLMPHKFVHNVL